MVGHPRHTAAGAVIVSMKVADPDETLRCLANLRVFRRPEAPVAPNAHRGERV